MLVFAFKQMFYTLQHMNTLQFIQSSMLLYCHLYTFVLNLLFLFIHHD